MSQLLKFPITKESAASDPTGEIGRLLLAVGPAPDAVVDFVGLYFERAGTRLLCYLFRDAEAWSAGVAMPGAPYFELVLSREEQKETPGAAELEQAVVGASWQMMLFHPKRFITLPPTEEGGEPISYNPLAGKEFIEV